MEHNIFKRIDVWHNCTCNIILQFSQRVYAQLNDDDGMTGIFSVVPSPPSVAEYIVTCDMRGHFEASLFKLICFAFL
jgi:hypothetical protein